MHILVDMSVDLRSDAHLKLEGEIGVCNVEFIVAFRHRLTEHLNVILFYIIEDGVCHLFVNDIIFHGCAIFLGDKACGHMSGTETRLGMFLADLFELLLCLRNPSLRESQ